MTLQLYSQLSRLRPRRYHSIFAGASRAGMSVVLIGCAVLACSESGGRQGSGAQQNAQQAFDTSAGRRGVTAREPLRALISKLPSLAGTFEQSSLGHWEFSGDTQLFRAIAEYGDSAVARLVECLGDTTRATATVEGRRVLVGYMCYAALDRTAYHEWDPADFRATKSKRWPGVLDPAAAPRDVRAAQKTWKDVVAHKEYSLS